MKILYPLGLLGLIGIAVLIIIYILRPKYQSKAVSSTFIWKLSLKYQKQKPPLDFIKNSLLFIIQLLVISLIAVMLSSPVIVSDAQSNEGIIVLEAGASMALVQEGSSRFNRAISDIISTANRYQYITVIVADSSPRYVVKRGSFSQAYDAVYNLQCTYAEADMDSAMMLAQDSLRLAPDADVILYTAKNYTSTANLIIKNMSVNEFNAAILDCGADVSEQGYTVFYAKIISCNRSLPLNLSLYIDGDLAAEREVYCDADTPQSISFSDLRVLDYSRAELTIDVIDSLPEDNRFILYGKRDAFKVQLYSEKPFFYASAFASLENYTGELFNITEVTQPAQIQTSGFDLYVYENYVPSSYPTDGAVWLLNPNISTKGITIGESVSGKYTLQPFGGQGALFDLLTKDLPFNYSQVTAFKSITDYTGYTPILSLDDSPALLVRDENGLKTCVLNFDIRFSNLPLLGLLPMLVRNMSNFSLCYAVDSNLQQAGNDITITLKPTAYALEFEGEIITPSSYVSTYPLTRTGEYTLTQYLSGGKTATESFFARIAQAESNITANVTRLRIPVAGSSGFFNSQSLRDLFLILAIAAMVLITIEWGLQYREN